MEQKKRKEALDDELLDHVVGGAKRCVSNPNAAYVNIRSGPGSNYGKDYSLNNGESVYTNGSTVYNEEDGYSWSQLDDGKWVPSDLLG